MRKPYPCKDCDTRKVGCHASCETYLEVKKINDESKIISEGERAILDYEKIKKEQAVKRKQNRPIKYGGWKK